MEEENVEVTPSLQFGPHPLGGIEARLRDRDGTTVAIRMDVSDAANAIAHLQALVTMAFQTAYAQMIMAEQNNKIVVPGQ